MLVLCILYNQPMKLNLIYIQYYTNSILLCGITSIGLDPNLATTAYASLASGRDRSSDPIETTAIVVVKPADWAVSSYS